MANLATASPGVLYLEDANDLALWRTRPLLTTVEGRLVGVSPVPPLAEWLAEDPANESVDATMGGMGGAVGNLFGMGG